MRLGMVGLGRMGANMAARLRHHGHEVVGFDRDPELTDVGSLDELVRELAEPPRVVWVMLPAGEPTDRTIGALVALLAPGDVVVDGGNSWFRDSLRHGEQLAGEGVGFVDAGVSGGVWGLDEGYSLMVGGDPDHVALARPAFEALSPGAGGFAHVGPVGAGHFTKMVHNGIEYGLMQAYAEGYELLEASEIPIDTGAALSAWREGSVVRSWLLDLMVEALDTDPGLAGIEAWADDSGEGRWTVQEAVRLAVPVPAISAALYARFASRQESSPAMRMVAALRAQFGGHATRPAGATDDPATGTDEGTP